MARWYWKSDLRLKDDEDQAWTPYSVKDSTKIEKAFQKEQKTMNLDDTYKIDFMELIQHRKDDKDRQRPIKREEDEKPKKRKKTVDENNNNNKKTKQDTTLRAGGSARIHDFSDTKMKDKLEDMDIEGGDFVPFSKIGLDPEKKGIRYADLLDFDDYRGVGLFVAGFHKGKFGMFKTRGEFGYFLPVQFKHLPKAYFNNHDAITVGYDIQQEADWDSDYEDD